MGRYLGIDYGSRRMGLAVSDEIGLLALPLRVIPIQNAGQAVNEVDKICREKSVTQIVVGLPLNMNGSRGPAAEAVTQFVDRLRQRLGLPVITWDERLSSQQAERVLIESDVRRAQRRNVIDKIAAQMILQSYLDAQAVSGPPATSDGHADSDAADSGK